MMSREEYLHVVEAYPLHARFGFTIDAHSPGRCEASCTIGPEHLNIGGVVHGGVMYLLMDVAAYCAAVTVMPEGMNATTHDIHISVMRPTPPDVQLTLIASVKKAGRSLYFIDCEATVDDRLVASARVTKSLIPLQR
ncbi:MAG: PaaI family thioesterase [Myxococcota bacterium]